MSNNEDIKNNVQNSNKDNRPPLPTHDLTTKVSEIFELVGDKKRKR